MKRKKIRCKACGFIFGEGLYDECPACGVPSKMFEPFEDKLPEGRRKWLDKHLHGIIVHAPQGLGFLLIPVVAIFIVASNALDAAGLTIVLYPALLVMSILLPLTVFGGWVSGMIDGRVRYKTISSIILKRKIFIGAGFLLSSIAMLITLLQPAFINELGLQILYLVLNLLAFGCSVILGRWGASLNLGEMPGPYPKKKKKVATPPAEA